MLAGVQARYLKDEGVRNRGPQFANTVGFLGEVSKKDSPVDEREMLETLGPPDFESRNAMGVMYVYLYDLNAKKDSVAYIECFAAASPLRITWGDANPSLARRYTPFVNWPDRRKP